MRIPLPHPVFQAALRLCLAISLAGVLPLSHLWWGETYPGDGQHAFGALVFMAMIGLGIAVVFFVVGSAVQFALRKRKHRRAILTDLVLWTLLAGVLTYAGISARYSDTQEEAGNRASLRGQASTLTSARTSVIGQEPTVDIASINPAFESHDARTP
ncbi:hypothetical protein G4G28_05105 [Massilia sp. Dwa41.01b]|uniref:hypothetical protein n=2 Tax=unclassified Massilia TaxID=2609279 RepID=UPI00160319BE|nr:hypothetical protein [Massilia sp. Dwa41.01b]QNA88013.1 hypothetical protein G4G28_05105 [Massilia sp. Dwa41.01b]